MGLKTLIEACWYGKNPSILYPLVPLEYIFKRLASRRKKKLSKSSQSATVPVIVVGNIVVGGTGKTPVLIALAKILIDQGLHVGVISRGYGRSAESLHIVSPLSTPNLAGDEPIEIFRATGCPVVVSEDRSFALSVLLKSGEFDVVLSDDGLQHYALSRQLEIAVFNQFHGIGNGHCLPLGPLREPVARLDTVNFILINKSATEHASIKELRKHVHSDFEVTPVSWVNVKTLEQRSLEQFSQSVKNKRMLALAGIGQPKKFFNTLSALQLEFNQRAKKDHAYFSESDFPTEHFDVFVMTAKDAVKCRDLAPENSWYLNVQADFPDEFVAEFQHEVAQLMAASNTN